MTASTSRWYKAIRKSRMTILRGALPQSSGTSTTVSSACALSMVVLPTPTSRPVGRLVLLHGPASQFIAKTIHHTDTRADCFMKQLRVWRIRVRPRRGDRFSLFNFLPQLNPDISWNVFPQPGELVLFFIFDVMPKL